MRIGIIGPTEDEIMQFVDKIEDKNIIKRAMLNFYTGSFEGCPVVAVCSGICKVNAAIVTQIMIDKFDVSSIILTGVAGALDDRLHIGDIVIGNEIGYHDVEDGILTNHHPWLEDIYFKADNKMIQEGYEISKTLDLNNKCYI